MDLKEDEKRKSTVMKALPQILAVSVKNILLLAYGLTLGYPTILIPGLTDDAETFNIGAEGLSWIGSINLICVPFGCVISGSISQALGRKKAMQLSNLPFIAAWLLFKFSNAEWQIFLALALTGLTGGFLEAPVLTYVAEISQPHLRGMLSSSSSLFVISGVLIMFLLGTFFSWRSVALVCLFFNVLSFTLLFFIPESPHWLISKNRLLDARESLAWLRGWTNLEEIEPEYKQIFREVMEVENGRKGVENGGEKQEKVEARTVLETLKLYTKRNFLWPYCLVSMIFMINQFSGMSTLQTYAVQIFASFQAPIDKYYATVILGVVELMGCILCVFLIHYMGKRRLSFISVLGSCLAFSTVAVYAYTNQVHSLIIPQRHDNSTNLQEPIAHALPSTWIPLTAFVFAAFITHSGMRVLPWILIGEVFSNETRAGASGLAGAVSYVFGFISNKIFFNMVALFSIPGTYFFYGAVSFLGFLFLYFFLPETEGKTLGQITEHFNGGKKMGDHVYRKRKGKVSNVGAVNEAYVEERNGESRL